ncbi:MAG: hypothetical protein QOH12_3575 [Solirubrobacteraceae bacterium]|nr:hypothetical protein [Solirubrobacteraceae bacterium]
MLRRFRHDLDKAGRASAESRAHGLRGLAEQAVLAVELEVLLNDHEPELDADMSDGARGALRRLKDRMLAQVTAAGLEIVRLRGVHLRDVAGLAEVECWSYDDVHSEPVVVEELEAAVRLDGTILRRGRVVIGGQRAGCVDGHRGERELLPRPPSLGEDEQASERPPLPRITCPIANCGAENHAVTEVCIGCLTPLAAFSRLTMYPEVLFNRGLRAARLGDSATARECFAAVVLWQPQDVRTRNAHALACLDDSDVPAARDGWEQVIARSPNDPLALRGLAALTFDPAVSQTGPERFV